MDVEVTRFPNWKFVSVADRNPPLGWLRKSGPEGRMWPTAIVVRDPFFQDHFEMLLAQRNQKVEALAPHRPNQALANSVGFRAAGRRPHNPNAEASDGVVQL